MEIFFTKTQFYLNVENIVLLPVLYYYMINFCNLIGLEQCYFSLI